jgi:hypothetical protein
MPIPTPRKGEEEQNFVSRCMGNEVMVREYDQKQRAAICYSQFKKRKEAKGSAPYWHEVEEEVVSEALKDKGIFLLNIPAVAKVSTQCDNCKSSIDTAKPPKPKNGINAKPNPAIQAELETGVDTGETKTYHFCDEECLRQYLNKRNKK